MPQRKIAWLEMSAPNRLQTAQFYADIFGLELKDYPDMRYTTLATGNADLGIGIGQPTEENPGGTYFYFESDDLEADLEAIKRKGGQVVAEPFEVPNVGSMAFFRDPGGNIMALGKFIPPGG